MTISENIFNHPKLSQAKEQGSSSHESRGAETLRREETATKTAFLINGNSYFAELARTLRTARRTIWIIGWDFNPDIVMEPEKSDETLGDILHALCAANPKLEIRILIWVLGPLYSEKSMKLLRKKSFPKSPGIDLRFDIQHAIRGSHHQKLVCVDDAVSFIGGMDLTSRRWDTRRHRAQNKLRRAPEGISYDPVHDVQAMVTGDAARLIGEIARRRWKEATGETHASLAEAVEFAWPDDRSVSLVNCPVSFAVTEPSTAFRRGIGDGVTMTLEIIARARRHLYIETQYLSSFRIADAIAARLQEEHGPEVVVVCTRSSHGLIEKIVMGNNRDRIIRRLRRADTRNRLCFFYPVVPAKNGEMEVLVHSKLIIADDHLVRIGSSNLNNRSEGLDSECDMLLAAQNPDHRHAIAELRNRLLAEFLGTAAENFTAAINHTGSMTAAVAAFNTGPRGLREFAVPPSGSTVPIAGTAIFDPARPLAPLRALGFRSLIRPLTRFARAPLRDNLADEQQGGAER
ncbi:phospholipase D-like domain-containing protein [Rhizobium viscosum]|uniref:Phospholipase D n=1 Tax=Rhizobium viscosum TaxID=1673 RepID=A0ABR9IYK5_RHIVS|nr:phospholipase D-like domain-containing protein [Rhizobium viscosum]MBE1508274.1 phospholipase D1/2 [Rhizobium viscosum]